VYSPPDPVRRDWVSGAALVVRRTVFEQVGGFDERYFMYFEDVDLCARIRREGYEVHYIAGVSVEHLGGGSQAGGKAVVVEKEFRKSQILCYFRYSSAVDRVLLRVYLFMRFLPQLVLGGRDRREVASYVLPIILRPADERRH
jgi:N-acetylglucosaminyl-diphospho-decaprenol L-rhamnosyltransferase